MSESSTPSSSGTNGRELRFGLCYAYLDSDRRTATDPARRGFEPHWADILDHVAWADSAGFDTVWFSEHHFDVACPSSPLMAAAAAMRTKRVRISSIVALAPLYHPLRLAEEAAMASVLSNGRYDLGIGAGYNKLEYDAFGVNFGHRPSLMEETVEICRRSWSGEPFSFEGKRFTLPEIAVTPVPASPPRILMGGLAEPAIRRAAQIGDGFLSSDNAHLSIYIDALAEAGRQGTAVASQVAFIAEDPERAAAESEEYILNYVNAYVERGFTDHARFTNVQEAVDSGLYSVLSGDEAVAQVVDAVNLSPVVEEVCFLVMAGPGEPIEKTYPRAQYLIDYVIPEVRKRVQGRG